jgi:hypothetical protein
MDASKLTVSPDKLRFQKMSPTKRLLLRRKNVIDLIKSKPYGSPITLAEFQAVTQLRGSGGVHSLLMSMVKKGMITKEKTNHRNIAWTVTGEPRIVKPARHPVEPPKEVETMQIKSLEEYAREFSWQHNSDSLREFVKFMDNIELDLRRLLSGGGQAPTKPPVKHG